MVRYSLVFLLAAIACHPGAPPRRDPQPVVQNGPRDPVPAVTVPETPAAQLVLRLVERRPRRMSELEAIVGPIAMSFRDEDLENMGMLRRPRDSRDPKAEFTALVPRLSIDYWFDMYHETPTRPRDVRLETFTLEVRGDAAIAEQVLRDQLGPPRILVRGTARYAAFHPFYVTRDPQRADRFRLSWYAEVPRFAIPEPDPRLRAAWLRELARRLATARSIDEVDAFCKAAPADAGIEITGTLNRTANSRGRPTLDPRDYWITFVPPLRATVLADAFEWGAIVGVSHDVHLSSWHIERRADSWLPTTGATTQWEVRASFAGSPSGGIAQLGGGSRHAAREVGADDELHSLSIRPRFK
jgi:hypothetical protein